MVIAITILLLYASFFRTHAYRLDICETVTSQTIYLNTFAHLKLISLIFVKSFLGCLTFLVVIVLFARTC